MPFQSPQIFFLWIPLSNVHPSHSIMGQNPDFQPSPIHRGQYQSRKIKRPVSLFPSVILAQASTLRLTSPTIPIRLPDHSNFLSTFRPHQDHPLLPPLYPSKSHLPFKAQGPSLVSIFLTLQEVTASFFIYYSMPYLCHNFTDGADGLKCRCAWGHCV